MRAPSYATKGYSKKGGPLYVWKSHQKVTVKSAMWWFLGCHRIRTDLYTPPTVLFNLQMSPDEHQTAAFCVVITTRFYSPRVSIYIVYLILLL